MADLYLYSITDNTIIQPGRGNVGIGTAFPQAKLDVGGTIRGSVIQITGGADLAEPFVVGSEAATKPGSDEGEGAESHDSDAVRPGAIVVIDPANPGQLKLAKEPYDRKVAGIISGANGLSPGVVMKADDAQDADTQPVALSGRVWCWCDASYGAIDPGDRLTTSTTPGHAMKVTDRDRADGAVIGKAMTALDSGTGLVLVLVSLQ
jgi:hypothetical protein